MISWPFVWGEGERLRPFTWVITAEGRRRKGGSEEQRMGVRKEATYSRRDCHITIRHTFENTYSKSMILNISKH